MYNDLVLQKAIRLPLELFVKKRKHGKANFVPRDRAFKVYNPNLYQISSYIECYYFCQYCKDYFDTADAMRPQRVPLQPCFYDIRSIFVYKNTKSKLI